MEDLNNTKILEIKNLDNIYQEVAEKLYEYREMAECSISFIVEGTKENPIIEIKYPGKKVKKRESGRQNRRFIPWANLYDFVVIPFNNNKEISPENFTFEKILRDFEKNKKNSEEFWNQIENVYYHNKIIGEPMELSGINSKLDLLMLKWIWVQEDFNYKLSWEDLNLPETQKYKLETRTGTSTKKGAGRAKFFAALILLKFGFTFDEVKKIIPFY